MLSVFLKLSYQVIIWNFINQCRILGTLAGNATDFEHTTLGNLDPHSHFLWAHISLAFCLFPLSILFMRRFSVDLRFTQLSLEMSRTLLIENIPKNLCRSTEEVKRYFVVMLSIIFKESIKTYKIRLLIIYLLINWNIIQIIGNISDDWNCRN